MSFLFYLPTRRESGAAYPPQHQTGVPDQTHSRTPRGPFRFFVRGALVGKRDGKTSPTLRTTQNSPDRGWGEWHVETTCLAMQRKFSAELSIESWEERIRPGFQPSRNRHIQSALESTAAISQRSGSALPGFSPRGVSPTAALSPPNRVAN